MRRIVVLLCALFVVGGLVTPRLAAQEKQEKKEKAAVNVKESRWHGMIIRMNMDKAYLDVRRGTAERRIHFDSSTKWTEGDKPAEMSKFKEGSDVICLGTPDEKKEFHATRIDLRKK